MRFRAATPSDADALARVVAEGFETYRSFAPPDWSPPDPLELGMGLVMHIAKPWFWCRLAEDEDGALAGQAAFIPATEHRVASDDPKLAHVVQLFVRPPYWGTGLARELHAAMVAEAESRGFEEMRLFTPAGQKRARGFYEREGWAARGEPWVEADLGSLEIVEYRRTSMSRR